MRRSSLRTESGETPTVKLMRESKAVWGEKAKGLGEKLRGWDVEKSKRRLFKRGGSGQLSITVKKVGNHEPIAFNNVEVISHPEDAVVPHADSLYQAVTSMLRILWMLFVKGSQ